MFCKVIRTFSSVQATVFRINNILTDNNIVHARLAFTAIHGKVVFPKALTASYERARDDGLLHIIAPKLRIISLKQHQGKFTGYQGNSLVFGPE